MPLFQALVTETTATRRWYIVRARNRSEAKGKLNVGDTIDEQDVLGSAEVLSRVIDPDTIQHFVQVPLSCEPVEAPTESEPCDCQLPGSFCSGVPGILAKVENCRVVLGGKVERCDQCQRYPSDDAAHEKLVELGMI